MKIPAADVQDMLVHDPDLLLVDVRTREEFDAAHIAGAGCMSAEEMCDCLYDEALGERGLDLLANAKGMELSDDASVIVLYSGTGERSAQVAQHMEALGYVNVYDAGGLNEWPYGVVTTAEELAAGAKVLDPQQPHGHEHHECECGHDHHHGGSCGCGC